MQQINRFYMLGFMEWSKLQATLPAMGSANF